LDEYITAQIQTFHFLQIFLRTVLLVPNTIIFTPQVNTAEAVLTIDAIQKKIGIKAIRRPITVSTIVILVAPNAFINELALGNIVRINNVFGNIRIAGIIHIFRFPNHGIRQIHIFYILNEIGILAINTISSMPN